MKDTLHNFVAEVLSEITRYEKETGKRYDVKAEIKKYVSKSHPAKYAFTMTDIPKVGINPRTSFNTPAGVYAYPLNQAYYNKLLASELPFANDKPYCNIMKLNMTGKWLIPNKKGMDCSSDQDVQDVIAKLGETINSKYVEEHGSHWNFGNDAKIYDLTYFATKNLSRSTVEWAKKLRALGYIGIYDPGSGTIYPQEPDQLVCLTPDAYEWVDAYETKEIRKIESNTFDVTKVNPGKENLDPKYLHKKIEEYDLTNSSWDQRNDWIQYAGNKNVLPKDLIAMYDKMKSFSGITNDSLNYELVRNPSSPPNLLQRLYDDVPRLLKFILSNPNCPKELLELPESIVWKGTISANPNAPYDLLKKIGEDFDNSLAIVSHKDVTPDDLEKAFLDNEYIRSYANQQVVIKILANPKCPVQVIKSALLRYATDDNSTEIRGLARAAIGSPNLPDDLYNEYFRKAIDPRTPKDVMNEIAASLKLHPNDAIKLLKICNDESIRKILLHTSFSPDVLDALSRKYTKQQQLISICLNPNASIHTLGRLAQHPDATVASTAKLRAAKRKKATYLSS